MRMKSLTVAIALVLAPALVIAQKVSYDYEKTANFTAFKTYAHKDGTKVGQPLIDDRIVRSHRRAARDERSDEVGRGSGPFRGVPRGV